MAKNVVVLVSGDANVRKWLFGFFSEGPFEDLLSEHFFGQKESLKIAVLTVLFIFNSHF